MTEPSVAVAVRDQSSAIAELVYQVELIQDALRTVMKPGVHYGQLEDDHGNARLKKPMLYKAGAEKLMQLFKLRPRYEELASVHQDKFVAYRYRCVLVHYPTGNEVGEGIGSCNSRERKYQKSDPWDIDNTIVKMACKRGLASAIMTATAASDIFDPAEAPVSVQQHRYLNGALIPQLEEQHPGGPDGDGWEEWTRRQALEIAGVESRSELNAEEMSELIEATLATARSLAEEEGKHGATTAESSRPVPAGPSSASDPDEDIPFGDPIDASDPKALLIDFGKYRDMVLGEIELKDPGYVDWLARDGQNAAVKEAARQVVAAR